MARNVYATQWPPQVWGGRGGRGEERISGATSLIVELPVLDRLVNFWLLLSAHTIHGHITRLELLMELCKLLEVVLQ